MSNNANMGGYKVINIDADNDIWRLEIYPSEGTREELANHLRAIARAVHSEPLASFDNPT